eukprot:5618597-Pleurochrysis_carterae.AAC.1
MAVKKWPNKRCACPVEPAQRGRWPTKRKASRSRPSREGGFGGGQALSSASKNMAWMRREFQRGPLALLLREAPSTVARASEATPIGAPHQPSR